MEESNFAIELEAAVAGFLALTAALS